MKILIACEFSGVVRDAFIKAGHDAWSCDLLDCERGGNHLKQDALQALSEKWDLLIAHPPCTYLCNSGVCWLSKNGVINHERHLKMQKACDFFAALYHANHIPRRAVENPIMHKYARDYLQSAWKIPRQTCSFQPWQHGHGEVKRTCLWLVNLPALQPSRIVSGREQRAHKLPPSPTRAQEMAKTLDGVAMAMANQWGGLL